METLTFSYNWNHKLDCNYFSTIRVDSAKFKVGINWRIVLHGKRPREFQAELVKVTRVSPKQINSTMIMLDTGYDFENGMQVLKRMYKDKFDSLTFAYCIFRNISALNENNQSA